LEQVALQHLVSLEKNSIERYIIYPQRGRAICAGLKRGEPKKQNSQRGVGDIERDRTKKSAEVKKKALLSAKGRSKGGLRKGHQAKEDLDYSQLILAGDTKGKAGRGKEIKGGKAPTSRPGKSPQSQGKNGEIPQLGRGNV